jgi:hypothetical protein
MALPQVLGALGGSGRGGPLAEIGRLLSGSGSSTPQKTGYFEVVNILTKILSVLDTRLVVPIPVKVAAEPSTLSGLLQQKFTASKLEGDSPADSLKALVAAKFAELNPESKSSSAVPPPTVKSDDEGKSLAEIMAKRMADYKTPPPLPTPGANTPTWAGGSSASSGAGAEDLASVMAKKLAAFKFGGGSADNAPAGGGGKPPGLPPEAATGAAGLMGGISGILSKAGPAGVALDLVVNGLGNLVGVLGKIKQAATGLGDAVAPFVRLANPGIVTKFMQASDDLTASIGRALVPVMEHATIMVRMVADAFFALSGPLQKAFGGALKEVDKLLNAVFRTVEPVISVLGTLINTFSALAKPINSIVGSVARLVLLHVEVLFQFLGKTIELLLAPLEAFAMILGDVADALSDVIDEVSKWIRNLLGLKSIAGGSVGAAVRPASFGSVEDYGKKAQQAAFSLGTAASPAEKTAGLAQQIYDWLVQFGRDAAAWPQKVWDTFAKTPFGTAVIRWINSLPSSEDSTSQTVGKLGSAAIGPESGRWLEGQTAGAAERKDALLRGNFGDAFRLPRV